HLETLGRLHDGVAVAHPGGLLDRLLGEQHAAVGAAHEAHLRRAVLARARLRDLAAELTRHHLEAVADAERRHPELEDARIQLGGSGLVHARGPAREHDARRILRGDLLGGDGVRHDLAVDPGLAHPARDELGVLGAEVDDEHGALRYGALGGHAHALSSWEADAAYASVVARGRRSPLRR